MRHGLTLRLALSYLAKRGVIKPRPVDDLQLKHELMATPEERAEAVEMADGLEDAFRGQNI